MFRFCAAAITAVLVSAMLVPPASAKELKPKFGDIGGVYYTDVAENREACRQAIKNKIALCRQNTSFVSNTLDRKYPGCLPIFRQQAGVCVTHFRRQTSKCDVFGSARIDDFTGFGCTVTATVVEEGGEPERTEPESGTESRDPASQRRDSAVGPSPKCAGMSKGAECWHKLTDPPNCYFWFDYFNPKRRWSWSGGCRGGLAEGRGTLAATGTKAAYKGTGLLVKGKSHGHWTEIIGRGVVGEGSYVNGRRHGRWVTRYPDGVVADGPYENGKMHGELTIRWPDGKVMKSTYENGREVSTRRR